jgi:hypothetical protein
MIGADPVRFAAARDLVSAVDRVEELQVELNDLHWRIFLDYATLWPAHDLEEPPVKRSLLSRRVAAVEKRAVDEEPPAPHPPNDCERCGKDHIEWSFIQTQAVRLAAIEKTATGLREKLDGLLLAPDVDPIFALTIINGFRNPSGHVELSNRVLRDKVGIVLAAAPSAVRLAVIAELEAILTERATRSG